MNGQREDRDGETPNGIPAETTAMLDTAGLDRLVDVLIERGYRVVGPTVRDNAIVLAELESAEDLPAAGGSTVGPGHYRLHRRDDDAAFAHSAGPQSWSSSCTHPGNGCDQMIAGGEMSDGAAQKSIPRYAFIGVRGCDLAGIATLDRVLGGGKFPDGSFARCRRQIFVVAVNCTEPGGLCFCASMGTGPAVGTRLRPCPDRTRRRRRASLPCRRRHRGWCRGTGGDTALPGRRSMKSAVPEPTSKRRPHRMGRQMPSGNLRDLLRVLAGVAAVGGGGQPLPDMWNCTMVCPTCFCTSTEDVTDLTGEHAERWQNWASCFEPDLSYIHGGNVRQSGASRYRQWLTHKLGTWHDQFGMSGCVGCGRCIAWCPTGIDITEEMNKMASADGDDD